MTGDQSLPPSRWWLPIGGIVAIMLVQGVASALLPPGPVTQAPVMVSTAVVGLALLLGSPLWVHCDRRYISAVSDWEPSGWYYWMILPPLTVALAPLYLLRRHQHVGVP